MNNFFMPLVYSIQNWFSQTLWVYQQTAVTPWALLRFLFFILLAFWLASFLIKILNKAVQNRPFINRSLFYPLSRLLHYGILSTGVMVALSTLGFDFSNLILLASALGVGLGFGLQAIFNNFFSGIILLFEGQLRIGDLIELEGNIKGQIQEINFRTTTLLTLNGTLVLVPNSALINAKVILDWTLSHPYRCLRIPFMVNRQEKNRTLETIQTLAKEAPFTIKAPVRPDPVVYFTKIKDGQIDCELIVWIEEKQPGLDAVYLSHYLEMIETVLIKHP